MLCVCVFASAADYVVIIATVAMVIFLSFFSNNIYALNLCTRMKN